MRETKGAWYSSKSFSRDHEADAKKALRESELRKKNGIGTSQVSDADLLQKRVEMDLFK
ncbi:hypothetical protein D3C77_517630 [compost metagenome]